VLAHPERIEAVQRDPEMLVGFVERGMLSQVTAGSVEGHFGRKVRDFTRTLLRRRLVHILASDTHFAEGRRSPKLSPGVEAAADIVGQAEARAMVMDTPRAVLDDTPIEVGPPRQDEGPKRWWRFW
jgi:protein-tyrosine phosphatase